MLSGLVPSLGSAALFRHGDVFLSGSAVGGPIGEYTPTGQLVQTLRNPSGSYANSMCFDSSMSHLIVPGVGLYDDSGNLVPSSWGAIAVLNCVSDAFGNVYASGPSAQGAAQWPIIEYDTFGNVRGTFMVPATDSTGYSTTGTAGQVALAPSGCTIYYGGYPHLEIGGFDFCNNTPQGTVGRFAPESFLLTPSFQIVADFEKGGGAALYDLSGNLLRRYPLPPGGYDPSNPGFLGTEFISPDPDGTSFWISGDGVYRYDINTGSLISAWGQRATGGRIAVYAGPPSTLAPPTASFTYSPGSPVTGSPVRFDGSASTCSDTPCSYTWSDDGSPTRPDQVLWPLGSGQSIQFTFHDLGTKYVRLVVTDASGRSATVEHDVFVGGSTTPTNPPIANFTYSPGSPISGSPITFDASSSTCDDAPCSYAWSDDGSPTRPNPVVYPLGTGEVLQFTFWTAGIKYVRLVVTDAQGRTATIEHDIAVTATSGPPPPPPPPPTPTASFSYSPTSPVAGSPVTFDGSSSTCPAGPCFFAWSDDGAPNGPGPHAYSLGSGSLLQYDFPTPGTKYVRLVVTDAMGRTATIEHDVGVSAIKVQASCAASSKGLTALLSAILAPRGKAAQIGTLLARGGYSVAWCATGPGHLAISWYAQVHGHRTPLLVASASQRFAGPGQRNINIALTHAGRRLLRSAQRVKLSAKGSFTPTGKTATIARRGFTVRR
jgi:hypothetical protein